MSFGELDFFENESENDGSGSGSPGTFALPFSSGKYVGSAGEYVGSVSGIGSGDFVQIVIESFGDVVMLVMFIPIGV